MLFASMVNHAMDMTAWAVTVMKEAAVAWPGFLMSPGRKELYVRGGGLGEHE